MLGTACFKVGQGWSITVCQDMQSLPATVTQFMQQLVELEAFQTCMSSPSGTPRLSSKESKVDIVFFLVCLKFLYGEQ